MPLSQLRQAITRLILPTADLGLREQTVDPLLFPDDVPPILAINAGQSAAGPKLQALGINGGLLQAVAPEGNTLNQGTAAPAAAAIQIVPANPNRYKLFIVNTGGTQVWIGSPAVAVNNGWLLATNGTIILGTGAAVWGTTGGVATTIFWLEESV